MEKNITKKQILINLYKNKTYGFIFIIILTSILALGGIIHKIVLPSFYNEMLINIVDESKRVGKHISRHQDSTLEKTVVFTSIDKLKDDFGIKKIKLFDKNGFVTFSTYKKDMGTKNKNDYFYEKVAKGEIFYKIAKKGTKSLEGQNMQRDIAEIYIPIMKAGLFIGASEIYYDITNKKESLNKLVEKIKNLYMISSLLFLLVLFTLLYSLSKKDILSKRMEISLYQKSKMASMGEMIGNIAHQWRQPLSSISMSASSLKLKKDLGAVADEDIDNFSQKIIDTTRYLSSTIDDFRNFFKKEKTKSFTSTKKLIDSSISILHGNFIHEQIEVITDIEDIDFETYENELRQVLLNVINNAKDKTKNNGFDKKLIFVEAKKDENNLNILVKDNGGGIPEEIIEKIFEPYFTTKHKSNGTGIGLYMSLEIIQNHLGGNLEAKNSTYSYDGVKYTGAIFNIKLPLKQNI